MENDQGLRLQHSAMLGNEKIITPGTEFVPPCA